MFRKLRIVRLEQRQRRQQPDRHHLSTVRIPRDWTDFTEAYLATLTCPCSVESCPAFTIGAVLPEKAPSAEAWAERAQQYYAQRRGSHA